MTYSVRTNTATCTPFEVTTECPSSRFDLTADGLSGPAIAAKVEALIARGAIAEGGVGIYASMPRLCHYDARSLLGKPRARWD